MVAITWQHPTPYYDDSYAVNSVNNGPYQDALLTELVPLLEKQFRSFPNPMRVFSPADRPAAGSARRCRSNVPISSAAAGVCIRIPSTSTATSSSTTTATRTRSSRTAHAAGSRAIHVAHAGGAAAVTQRQMSQLEAVLGSKARSGQQFDAWDAAYGRSAPTAIRSASGIVAPERSTRARSPGGATRATTLPTISCATGEERSVARRQDARLRRRHGQLLSQSRGLPHGRSGRRSSRARRPTSPSSTAGR